MGRIDIIEEKRMRNFSWAGPRYYDYPDGEDLIGKLKFTAIASGLPALVLGIHSGSGKKNKLFRILYHVIPIVGTAFAFTVATYFSTKLRKKDDEINYLVGAASAGTVVGALSKPHVGFVSAIFFGCLGYAHKNAMLNGTSLFPPVHQKGIPPYFERVLDFSLLKERKGNWTRDP